MANARISELPEHSSPSGTEYIEAIVSPYTPGTNRKIAASQIITTREFGRAWTETLLFDKNEIDYATHELTGDITYAPAGGGHLVNQFSGAVQTIIVHGTESISFTGFQFIYGIENGEIPDAGTYQIFFLARNGVYTANWTAPNSQVGTAVVLNAPGNFAAVADGQTAIDLSWTDVANETNYEIQVSDDGSTGWAVLSNPAANAVADTQTGLTAGTQKFYRIRAVGDGVNFLNSPWSTASATTESAGDVTAPTFTFSPTNGSSTWAVNRPIVITANEGIRKADATVLTSANIASVLTLKQTNSGGADIAFTATIDATKTIVTITPTTHYGATQLVYVAIAGVEDISGNEVAGPQSITFTTTDFTYFNGTSNRAVATENSIDGLVLSVNDIQFWLEITIKDAVTSGPHTLIGKWYTPGQHTLHWFINNGDIYFVMWFSSDGFRFRTIKWTGLTLTGTKKLVLKYNGALDTNDGLDRPVLEIDDVVQTSKTMDYTTGLIGSLASTGAKMSVGIGTNNIGVPSSSGYFSGEAKGYFIKTSSGTVEQLDIPLIIDGEDQSGNGRDTTWVS